MYTFTIFCYLVSAIGASLTFLCIAFNSAMRSKAELWLGWFVRAGCLPFFIYELSNFYPFFTKMLMNSFFPDPLSLEWMINHLGEYNFSLLVVRALQACMLLVMFYLALMQFDMPRSIKDIFKVSWQRS